MSHYETGAERTNTAPVDSGAIGRLNEAERDELAASLRQPGLVALDPTSLYAAVERILREHTDRALAEVEQRIRGIDYVAELEHGDNGDWMRDEVLAIVRAARQEQGR